MMLAIQIVSFIAVVFSAGTLGYSLNSTSPYDDGCFRSFVMSILSLVIFVVSTGIIPPLPY